MTIFVRYPGFLSLGLCVICLIPQSYLHCSIIKNNVKRCRLRSVIAIQIAAFFNSMYIIWTLWLSVYSVSSNKDTFDVIYCSYYFFNGVWLLLAKVSIYLFYIIRLYDILGKTAYRYNPKLLSFLCIALTILWFASCGPATYVAIRAAITIWSSPQSAWSHIEEYEHCADPLGNHMVFTQATVFSVIAVEILSSIVVLRLYLSKLVYLSITYNEMNIVMNQSNSVSNNDGNINNNNNNDNNNDKNEPSQTNITTNQSDGHQRHRSWFEKRKTNARFFKLGLRTTNCVILTISSTSIIMLFNGAAQYWVC